MPLNIKSINGDACFLLTFSPPIAPATASPGLFPGSFTILFDPWITGPTHILTPGFSSVTQLGQPCVKSLADLHDEPDLVLISQDKPDHCNKASLTQLAPDISTPIITTPAAAKKIRSWNHFHPQNIESLPPYDPSNPSSVYRISIPPPSPLGSAGEVTISILSPKLDMTGLHTAIGITYRPPATVLSASQSHKYINVPMTPPMSPTSPLPATPPSLPTSPTSPTFHSTTLSPSPYAPHSSRERAHSVLFSPHGAPYALVRGWAQRHLVREAALPLATLIHGFDTLENPWYLGGVITPGLPAGCEVARGLHARCWIGAHDAEKRVSGVGTRLMRCTHRGWAETCRYLEENGIEVNGRDREAEAEAEKGSEGGREDGSASGSLAERSSNGKSGAGMGKRTRMDVRVLAAGEEFRVSGV